MGIHISEFEADMTFGELFVREMLQELAVLKRKIAEMETRLEDPFG